MFNRFIDAWFKVDSRALGIYRILLGWICFWDILRRWNYIDIFYSDLGIKSQYARTSSFTIFKYIGNDSTLLHIVFAIGIIFSILLLIGYRTKLSHFIVGIIIISIHVSVTKVGNSGDMFLNCILVWTFFLPLGKSISVDSLIKSLKKYKENNLEDLNNAQLGFNAPKQIYSIAYFAMLFQISAIYFFTALDKHGADWTRGKAFYKMLQLDGFITSFGYYIRDYVTYPISKFFTYSALYLEYAVILLLFIPFYKHFLRLFAVISLTIFHLSIRLTMNIGLFTQVMITSFALLIDQKIFDWIKLKAQSKYAHNQFILFYDSDCGFCHYTVRIIKRLDVFNRIIFDHGYSDSNVKPKEFDSLADKTAMLYNSQTNQLWTRHQAFGKILSLLPFGFMLSWIFFIPYISELFGLVYDMIAKNRTKISIFFGLPACNLPPLENEITTKDYSQSNLIMLNGFKNHTKKILNLASPIILIIMLSAAFNSALVENPGVQSFLIRNKLIEQRKVADKTRKSSINKSGNYFNWNDNKMLEKVSRFPRMIQMWKMFSPNVLSRDNIIVVEAFLDNGSTINPFTGEKPVLDSTDFSLVMDNKSQLWRKYFENFRKFDATYKGKNTFKQWVMNPDNDYLKKNLNGHQIDSIKIWKISQSSPMILINRDGSFKGIKPPKAVKQECLSHKQHPYKRNSKSGNKEKPINSLQEYLDKIRVKK
tara:strand:- start:3010 stop:5127 length:2118 start_codon:yes stop_codon:yes gene_type:complete